MNSINLNKGLEALYYFDEQNFDNQTNQLQDYSGYGRHAVARGGPTVGVNGPDDFEAASFDGIDDYFSNNSVRAGQKEMTLTMLIKFDRANKQSPFSSDINIAPGIVLNTANGDLFGLRVWNNDGGRYDAEVEFFDRFNEYFLLTHRFGAKPSQFDTFFDDQLKPEVSTGDIGDNELRVPFNELNIGAQNQQTSNPLSGEVAFTALWRRALSYAEIEQLNRMTAPRRAQL